MIKLTQLSGKVFYLNPHQIESIDVNPDTNILMLSGKHIVVLEDIETVIASIVEYRSRIGGFKNEV